MPTLPNLTVREPETRDDAFNPMVDPNAFTQKFRREETPASPAPTWRENVVDPALRYTPNADLENQPFYPYALDAPYPEEIAVRPARESERRSQGMSLEEQFQALTQKERVTVRQKGQWDDPSLQALQDDGTIDRFKQYHANKRDMEIIDAAAKSKMELYRSQIADLEREVRYRQDLVDSPIETIHYPEVANVEILKKNLESAKKKLAEKRAYYNSARFGSLSSLTLAEQSFYGAVEATASMMTSLGYAGKQYGKTVGSEQTEKIGQFLIDNFSSDEEALPTPPGVAPFIARNVGRSLPWVAAIAAGEAPVVIGGIILGHGMMRETLEKSGITDEYTLAKGSYFYGSLIGGLQAAVPYFVLRNTSKEAIRAFTGTTGKIAARMALGVGKMTAAQIMAMEYSSWAEMYGVMDLTGKPIPWEQVVERMIETGKEATVGGLLFGGIGEGRRLAKGGYKLEKSAKSGKPTPPGGETPPAPPAEAPKRTAEVIRDDLANVELDRSQEGQQKRAELEQELRNAEYAQKEEEAAPAFEEVRELLPKDANGEPDAAGMMTELQDRFGKSVWNDLTAREKIDFYNSYAKPEDIIVPEPPEGQAKSGEPPVASDLKSVRAKGESDYLVTPEAAEQPDPYYGFHGDAAQLSDEQSGQFEVHGIATGDRDQALIDLLDNGIDPNREFHAGPPKPGVYGVDTTRTTAPYLLISDPGKSLRETGVKNIVLNGPAAPLKGRLQSAYPGRNFMTVAEAVEFMRRPPEEFRVPAPKAPAKLDLWIDAYHNNVPKAQWAKEIGASPEQMKALYDYGLENGYLRQDSRGRIYRSNAWQQRRSPAANSSATGGMVLTEAGEAMQVRLLGAVREAAKASGFSRVFRTRVKAELPEFEGQAPAAMADPETMTISLSARAIEALAAVKGVAPEIEAVRLWRHELGEMVKAIGTGDTGLWTKREWNTLVKAAEREGWLDQAVTGESLTTRQRYEDPYGRVMAGDQLQQALLREAICDRFSEYYLHDVPPPAEALPLFARLKDLLDRIVRFLQGESIARHDELFQKLDSGEIAKRLRELAPEAGTKEPRFVLAGVNAEIANLEALRSAKLMEKAGASRGMIWAATGWERTADGKWCFEINDRKAELTNRVIKDLEAGKEVVGPLSEILKHPELFRAYPGFDPAIAMVLGDKVAGAYQPGAIAAIAPNVERIRGIALHEIQHGVQRMEGYQPGGTPEFFRELGDTADVAFDKYRRLAGEEQARNVERRSRLGVRRTKEVAPSGTEQIPRLNQIISESEMQSRVARAIDEETRREKLEPTFSLSGLPFETIRGLYSAVSRVASGLDIKKGTGQQFLNRISRGPNVRKEEIDAMGLAEFLEGKKSVTKDEVLAFIYANQVPLETVTLGDPMRNVPSEAFAAVREWIEGNYEFPTTRLATVDDLQAGVTSQIRRLRMDGVPEHLIRPIEENMQEGSRYRRHSVPGGENYRELLIRLQSLSDSYTPEMNARLTEIEKELSLLEDSGMAEDEAPWRLLVSEMGLIMERGSYPRYTSPHFGNQEVVHIRADDRIGPKGENELFIHEIQSDLHQKARKFGYGKEGYEKANKLKSKLEAREEGLTDAEIDDFDAAEAYIDAFGSRGAPEAPFKGNMWLELALKKMLFDAADNHYDIMTWARPEEIAAAVGGSAEQLAPQYGEKIPNFLNKYLNKWEGKVEEIKYQEQVPADQGSYIYAISRLADEESSGKTGYYADQLRYFSDRLQFLDRNQRQVEAIDQLIIDTTKGTARTFLEHRVRSLKVEFEYDKPTPPRLGVRITPEIRAGILAGQPLFSLGGRPHPAEQAMADIRSELGLRMPTPWKKGQPVTLRQQIWAIANNGSERLVRLHGQSLAVFLEANAARIEAMALPLSFDRRAEGFSRFFEDFVLRPDNLRQREPELFDRFRDWLDDTNHNLLEAVDKVHDLAREQLREKRQRGIDALARGTGRRPGTPPPPPPSRWPFTASVQAVSEFWKRTFQPELVSDKALEADAVVARYKAAKAQEQDQIVRRDDELWQMWNKIPEDRQIGFIREATLGAPQATPEMGEIAYRYRQMLDHAWNMEKQWGSRAGYREDYLPFIFKNPRKARNFFAAAAESGRLGPKWFQKARYYELIDEARADGLELVSTNPQDLVTMRLLAGADMRQRMEMLAELEKIGVAVKAKGNDSYREMGWLEKSAPNSEKWLISPDIEYLWNNALQAKGLWGNEGAAGTAFRRYMAFKNVWVPIKLAVSAFHPIHVLHINLTQNIARGWVKLSQNGDFEGAIRELKRNPFSLGEGEGAMQAWLKPPEERSNYENHIVEIMKDGGFVPQLSEQLRIDARKSFQKALQKSEWGKIAWFGSKRAIEKIQAPIFEWWIPGLKAAAYLRDAQALLERRPELMSDPVMRRVALRAIAKSIDNRYGEMFYGGLFWNRGVKDAGIASFLSLSWQTGFLREFGGAAVETAARPFLPTRTAGRARQVARDATNKQSYVLAYLFTGCLILGGMSWIMSGEFPTGWDYVFPRIGGKNPDGSPRRITSMLFHRELPMLKKHIEEEDSIIRGLGAMIWNKTMFEPFAEYWRNSDYWGYELWDPNSSLPEQWAQFVWKELKGQGYPISISGMERAAELSGTWMDKSVPLAFLGFSPAPSYVEKTPLQNKIRAAYKRYIAPPAKPYAREDLDRQKREWKLILRRAIADGDDEQASAARHQLLKLGSSAKSLTKRQLEIPSDTYLFARLSSQPEVQEALIQQAPLAEYNIYRKYLNRKLRRKYPARTE